MSGEIKVGARDPDAARADIERTRARMSRTIDDIEDALLKKREHLRETLDVGAKVRANPLSSAGLVLGLGLLLGLLTGGRQREEKDDFEEVEERASLWEDRARRLLAIAHAQDEGLDELEGAVAEQERLVTKLSRAARRREVAGRWADVGEAASERLAGTVGDAARHVIASIRGRF